MSKAIELTEANFEQEVIKSELPVLVDFWASWCGPCQMMSPIVDALASEMEGKLKIAKLDVENPVNQSIAAEYQIMSIPNMKLFKDGKVIKDIVGARPKDMLKEELEALL